jgi:Rod binding domain-containing protein
MNAVKFASADPPSGSSPRISDLENAARGFEQTFVSQLLREFTAMAVGAQARESAPFADMLGEEYAKLVAQSGGLGIAPAIVRMLTARRVIR